MTSDVYSLAAGSGSASLSYREILNRDGQFKGFLDPNHAGKVSGPSTRACRAAGIDPRAGVPEEDVLAPLASGEVTDMGNTYRPWALPAYGASSCHVYSPKEMNYFSQAGRAKLDYGRPQIPVLSFHGRGDYSSHGNMVIIRLGISLGHISALCVRKTRYLRWDEPETAAVVRCRTMIEDLKERCLRQQRKLFGPFHYGKVPRTSLPYSAPVHNCWAMQGEDASLRRANEELAPETRARAECWNYLDHQEFPWLEVVEHPTHIRHRKSIGYKIPGEAHGQTTH